MARMFGLIANRSDLASSVLEAHADVLKVRRESPEPLGWGVGFYQSGEVLLRRRPIDEREVIGLAEAAEGIRADLVIGHVRKAGIGALRTENTHPFRYRSWLFAQTGTIQGFERLRERLLASQPDFLRRNVRGETDSELFFYLFLSFLHDAGRLDDGPVAPEHIRVALRASISLVDQLSAEEGFEAKNRGDILLSNGECIVAVHRDGTMGYRELKGRRDLENLLGEEAVQKARIPSIENSRFGLVASAMSELPQGWTRVTPRSIVTLSRTDEISSENL